MYNCYGMEGKYELTKATTEAKKIGGSLMVRIPVEIAKEEGIEEGDKVELQVKKVRFSAFGAYPGIGHMTREDELDTHD
jgi:antidote-toxin recognition MazE-like antitoxin